MLIRILISFCFVSFCFGKSAHYHVPENNLNISKEFSQQRVGPQAFTKEKVDSVIKKVADIYAPIVQESMGVKLDMINLWDEEAFNAVAFVPSGITRERVVALFGGFSRFPWMTEDALTFVLCHELGHHLGGFPSKTSSTMDRLGIWSASVEGQADYWGVSKCMRKVLSSEDNVNVIKNRIKAFHAATDTVERFQNYVDNDVFNTCKTNHSADVNATALCVRSAMAGYLIMNIFEFAESSSTGKKFELLSFQTTRSEVDEIPSGGIFVDHPSNICRLQTISAASLCEKSSSVEVSYDDPNQGICVDDEKTSRPPCWYNYTDFSVSPVPHKREKEEDKILTLSAFGK